MKKRLLSLVAIALMVSVTAMAQKEVGTIGTSPVIDGDISEWAVVPFGGGVSMNFGAEVPTFSDDSEIQVSGTVMPRWKAVWDAEAIYVLVEVPDDNFFNAAESGKESYEADKPEVYFDVNEVLVDGLGAKDGAGHIQVAPGDAEVVEGASAYYFYDEDDASTASAYAVEYKIMFSELVDNTEAAWDPTARPMVGFDVTVIDLDEVGTSDGGETETVRQRTNWVNVLDESWNNLDEAGRITLVDKDLTVGVGERAANFNVLASNLVVNGELEITVEYTNVKVMNTVGQVVSTSTNVSNLTNGVYIVAVTTVDGNVVANRFVKK